MSDTHLTPVRRSFSNRYSVKSRGESKKFLSPIKRTASARSASSTVAKLIKSACDDLVKIDLHLARHEFYLPHQPLYYEKRVCDTYVPNNKGVCVGCKMPFDNKLHKKRQTEWTTNVCTITSKTDAFGKVKFPGSYCKTASYIRIENETSPNDIIQYLYDKSAWGLTMPQLVISVTGGAQNFTIPQRMKAAFKRGLIKAATSTNAWIITGGTNAGVMRLVGEAVSEEFNNLTVIGIATWGKIALRNKLLNNDSNKEDFIYAPDDANEGNNEESNDNVALDPNHTHFILVDNGTNGEFGAEINFRANLELELSKGNKLAYYQNQGIYSSSSSMLSSNPDINNPEHSSHNKLNTIPMILIVVQGGPNSLKTICESIKKGIPVLILADSKGCADLISNAISLVNRSPENLMRLIINSQLCFNKKTRTNDEKRCEIALDHLKEILDHSNNLINVFRLDSGDGTQDIELSILRAFLNCRKTDYYENLKLALKWNRSDIAKTEIFTGEEQFKNHQLQKLMEIAIIENKPEFIDILLENRVNLYTFLTHKRLYFLYNSDKIHHSAKKTPFYQLLKQKYFIENGNKRIIDFNIIRTFCRKFSFECFKIGFIPDTDVNKQTLFDYLKSANQIDESDVDSEDVLLSKKIEYPAQNLFLWAILHNRIEIAKIFWRIGQHQICNALLASAILKKMASYLTDLRDELLKCADDFENLAIGVLNTFDMNTDDLINGVILLRIIPYYDIDSLQMAVEGDCKKFVSHSAIQNLLTDIWLGKFVFRPGLSAKLEFFLMGMSLGFLAPFFLHDRKSMISKLSELDLKLREYAIEHDIKIRKCLENYIREYKLEANTNEYKENDDDIEVYEKDVLNINEMEAKSTNNSKNDQIENAKEHDNNNDADYEHDDMNNKKNCRNNLKVFLYNYCATYIKFLKSPCVKCFYDVLFYTIYLLLFSYMMLCQFQFDENHGLINNINETSTQSNQTANSTLTLNNEIKNVVNRITWLQYLLIFWVFSFFCEELRQFLKDFNYKNTLKQQIRNYLSDSWNYLDISGCLLFTIGITLRIIADSLSNKGLFNVSRIILSIDLFIWYLRLLHVSLVFKSLGPKLVMMYEMIRDLMFFLIIIAIFVCSFGVTTQANLYPDNNKLNFELIKSIIHKAYWPIFGEIKILDDDLNDSNDSSNRQKLNESGVDFSFFALIFYMIIANVLLINLLIAMFSSTFQKVEANTDYIWYIGFQFYIILLLIYCIHYHFNRKFQRYRLVFEYYGAPFLPQPFMIIQNIINITKYLISKCRFFSKSLNQNNSKDNSEQFDLLLDYEKKYAEQHVRIEKLRSHESVNSKLEFNSEKLEALEDKLNEVLKHNYEHFDQLSISIKSIMQQMKVNQKPAIPIIQLNGDVIK